METKKLKFPIASILFAVCVVAKIYNLLHFFNYYKSQPILLIALITFILAVLLLAISPFVKKASNIISISGISLLVLQSIVRCFLTLPAFNFVVSIAYVLLFLIAGSATIPAFSKYKSLAKKLFFAPGLLRCLTIVVSAIYDVIQHDFSLNLMFMLFLETLFYSYYSDLFCSIGIMLFAHRIVDPYKKVKTIRKQTSTSKESTFNCIENPALDYNEAYCELVKHILLSLFTCGIWTLIWIHKTTKALNRTPGAEQYDPTKKLLLCMFVPFYMVYWFKKHGERIDKLNAMQNNKSDNATMYLLLGLFIPVVACILMQDNINKLCAPATTTPQFVSAATESTEKNNVELLKEYKELLDMGAITQEEFDAKKQQLLNF